MSSLQLTTEQSVCLPLILDFLPGQMRCEEKMAALMKWVFHNRAPLRVYSHLTPLEQLFSWKHFPADQFSFGKAKQSKAIPLRYG